MISKRILYPILLCSLLVVVLAACSKPSTTPEPLERVMLDVECGWELPLSFPDNPEGILKITDSLDDYSEEHTFTGIRTPETVGEPIFLMELP